MKRDPYSTVAPYFGWVVIGALAAGPAIDRADYQDRLRAMWLGKAIANWTGLRTEGQVSTPPFLTDAAWGTNPFPDRPWVHLDLFLYSNP